MIEIAAIVSGADLRGLLAWSRPRWAGKKPSTSEPALAGENER